MEFQLLKRDKLLNFSGMLFHEGFKRNLLKFSIWVEFFEDGNIFSDWSRMLEELSATKPSQFVTFQDNLGAAMS